jgi:tryptophan-rich sensory protein
MQPYVKFGAMIATSTLVMFGLMYLNVFQTDHILFSETRAYMALIMGAAMAIVMLAFMLKMYPRRGVNIAIFAGWCSSCPCGWCAARRRWIRCRG